MSKAKTREKNQAMAQRMKEDGTKRETGRCPICNRMVAVNKMYGHISTCK